MTEEQRELESFRKEDKRIKGEAMKKYTFEVVVEEGSDEFWESIQDRTGCDEVTECITAALFRHGFDTNYGTSIKLTKYDSGDV